jgi:hypothetical protein
MEKFRPGRKFSTLLAHFALAQITMSTGSWDPKVGSADSTVLLQASLLRRLIDYDREDQLAHLEDLLSDEDKQRLAGLMKIEQDAWRAAAESLPDTDLLHLIRFFAVAENLPGWEAGTKSPVIPLAKILRQRGARLDKLLLQWLREVNDNRYLPYGPL